MSERLGSDANARVALSATTLDVALTVRRVLDELVQVQEDLFLGKAHLHWWSGSWQTVAYFTVARDDGSFEPNF